MAVISSIETVIFFSWFAFLRAYFAYFYLFQVKIVYMAFSSVICADVSRLGPILPDQIFNFSSM